jgi:hypothetical protein
MHESAGKRRPAGSRKGNKWLASMLVEAASSVSRSKSTYLAAQYAQIASRRGRKRAALAVAHSMLVSAYYMLTRDEPYRGSATTGSTSGTPTRTPGAWLPSSNGWVTPWSSTPPTRPPDGGARHRGRLLPGYARC